MFLLITPDPFVAEIHPPTLPRPSKRASYPADSLKLAVVKVVAASSLARLLPDGDLDALRRKGLAQRRALAHARELLGREDGKYVAEHRCHDRGAFADDGVLIRRGSVWCRAWKPDVDKRESQPGMAPSAVVTPLPSRTTYRKLPSVLTLRSCKTNHIPMRFVGSVSRNALAASDPIRFRVNMLPPC